MGIAAARRCPCYRKSCHVVSAWASPLRGAVNAIAVHAIVRVIISSCYRKSCHFVIVWPTPLRGALHAIVRVSIFSNMLPTLPWCLPCDHKSRHCVSAETVPLLGALRSKIGVVFLLLLVQRRFSVLPMIS